MTSPTTEDSIQKMLTAMSSFTEELVLEKTFNDVFFENMCDSMEEVAEGFSTSDVLPKHLVQYLLEIFPLVDSVYSSMSDEDVSHIRDKMADVVSLFFMICAPPKESL